MTPRVIWEAGKDEAEPSGAFSLARARAADHASCKCLVVSAHMAAMLRRVKISAGVGQALTPMVLGWRICGRGKALVLVARLEVWGSMDARGAVRFLVQSETTVRGMDGRPFDAVVENFSRTGFMFQAEVALAPGTLIWIGLSGAGAREAKVVWQDGPRHGCEFLMPLGRRDLQHAFRSRDAIVEDLEARLRRASMLPEGE